MDIISTFFTQSEFLIRFQILTVPFKIKTMPITSHSQLLLFKTIIIPVIDSKFLLTLNQALRPKKTEISMDNTEPNFDLFIGLILESNSFLFQRLISDTNVDFAHLKIYLFLTC